jgi:AcrR family transcriptional regulator
MTRPSLQDERTEVLRTRVVEGAVELLRSGGSVTFKEVARVAGVPERTIYRHFPTRSDLLAAVYGWANEALGLEGPRPTTAVEHAELLRRSFAGFDELAPVVRQMLIEPEATRARAADAAERRAAAVGLVRHEVPGLDADDTERLAAVIQVLGLASTWQGLGDFWDLDGPAAGDAVARAVELLLEGARAHTDHEHGDQP